MIGNRLLLSCLQLRLLHNSCFSLSPLCHARNNKLPGSSSSIKMQSSTSSPSSSHSHSAIQRRQRIHFNHAGASPSPQRVIDRVYKHLTLEQAEGGYAAQRLSQDSGDVDKVYHDVARLIHSSATEIALVESATVGWTRAFYAMVQRDEQERKERLKINKNDPSATANRVILISEAEYAANVVAACQWAKDHNDNWMVLAIPSATSSNDKGHDDRPCSTGVIDLKAFDTMLEGTFCYENNQGVSNRLDPSSIALVAITHVPTNSGIVNPVEAIGERIEAYNQQQKEEQGRIGKMCRSINYLVDACQSVGQLDVNVQKIKCHGLVATGRKYLRGPRGTGFLYISNSILAKDIMPSHIDHYGCPVRTVPSKSYRQGVQLQDTSVIDFAPREDAKRFEFWESNISSRMGLQAAVEFCLERGLPQISRDIQKLSALLRQTLEEEIPSVKIHHKETTICGIVTFYIENVGAKTIQEAMEAKGFELSVVPATSTPLDSSVTNVPNLVRASISYTNTEREIRAFCSALKSHLLY